MIIDNTKAIHETLDEIALERSESDSGNYHLLNYLNTENAPLPFDKIKEFPNEYPFDSCHTLVEKQKMYASLQAVEAAFHVSETSRSSYELYDDLIQTYYRNIRILDSSLFRNDPFLSDISLPLGKEGDFLFGFHSYEKNRLFHYGTPVENGYGDVQKLAWFQEDVKYPFVTRDGQYFSSVSADQILTASSLIRPLSQNVLVLGCGIGYLPYMIHQKKSVSSVTIVENDPDVIHLFENQILPQFEYPEKIRIISPDAYAYMKEWDQDYQWVIDDLYNDSMNGVISYLSLKKLESLHKHTKYAYWIEDSILSNLKSALLILVMSSISENMEDHLLSDEEQGGEIVNALRPFTDNLHIHTNTQLKQLFSNKGLRKFLTKQGALL